MSAEKIEHACGCIPYRIGKNNETEVLLVLRDKGFWEFPKGKREAGEGELACALRELKEETGLSGTITAQVPIQLEYFFSKNGEVYHKQVSLFLCLVEEGSVVYIDKVEVVDYAWLPLSEVADRLTYNEMKDAARRARERLET